MSRASTERDHAVEVMQMAVLDKAFERHELEAMLMAAVKSMTVTEMENLVKEHTTYEDLMMLEVCL
jgi:hypothetical protein